MVAVVAVVRARRVKRCLGNSILGDGFATVPHGGDFFLVRRGETPHIQLLHRVKLGSHNCDS